MSTEGTVPDRDSIRAAIFAGRKPVVKKLQFMGAEIELRQPTVEEIVSSGDIGKDEKRALVYTLVNFAYIPGTDIKIFTPEDADAIAKFPWGVDMQTVANAFGELTGANFKSGNAG